MHDILQAALKESKRTLSSTDIREVDCLATSFINTTWRLKLNDGGQLFAKTAPAKDFQKLKFEANGLKLLHRFSNPNFIEIPTPVVLKQLNNHSILILPWLDVGVGDQANLGKGLALLHQASTVENPGKFGWDLEGFIGAGPQPAGWDNKWGKCFIHLRLIPQLRIAAKWGINISDWEKLLEYLIVFLEKHKPTPTIVHGDLWSGNAAIQKNGRGVIYDPATWWADREVDLAMTRLFGGFSNDFYRGYESIWPLPPSSKFRTDIYNLYHLLNHANIFGGSYKAQSLSNLKNIDALILSS